MSATDPRAALPAFTTPAGACDTHMHFYNRRYKASDKAWLFPPDRTVADYRKVQARLGLERTIIVQPVTYGFDNSCTLDALAEIGATARAVVTVPPSIADAELDALWQRGARGLRFHQMRGGVLEWDDLVAMAPRLAGTGYHVQVQCEGGELVEREALIAALPCTVVIDHMGRYAAPLPLEHEAVRALLRLAARDNVFVKISGFYYISATGAPLYEDVWPLARALADTARGRLLWGSDWPHPTKREDEMPDDGELLAFLAACAPTDAERQAILVDTPSALYGF